MKRGLKIRTYEFDENGNIVYRVASNNYSSAPFIGSEKGIELRLFGYNDNKLKIYECIEDERWMIESLFEYDEKQNLSQSEIIVNNKTITKNSFEWKKGKMVKSKVIYPEDPDDENKTTYNQDGKIIESKSDSYTYTYDYQRNRDTTICLESSYHQDTLTSIKSFSYLGESESQFTHFLSMNSSGEKRREVFVKYDQKGNTTDYHFKDYFKKHSAKGEEPNLYQVKF